MMTHPFVRKVENKMKNFGNVNVQDSAKIAEMRLQSGMKCQYFLESYRENGPWHEPTPTFGARVSSHLGSRVPSGLGLLLCLTMTREQCSPLAV